MIGQQIQRYVFKEVSMVESEPNRSQDYCTWLEFMSGSESWDHESSNFGTLDLYFLQVLRLEPDGFWLVKQYNNSANDKHGINSMSFDITKNVRAKLLLMITLNCKINNICLSKNRSTTERSLWTDIFVRTENNPSCIIRDGRVCL